MAHLIEYTVTVVFLNLLDPVLANYCELYYNDGYDYYSYKKYCSQGCCYDRCCYTYYGYTYQTLSVGLIIGIIVGCMAGASVCFALCVCVFKCCCKSEAAQAGQIIRQPGQQIAYIQPTQIPAQANNYGQQFNPAYSYSGVNNPVVNFTASPPPTYEAALLCPPVTSSCSNTSPNSAVTTEPTFTNIATVSDNNVTSPLSADGLSSTEVSPPSNTTDFTSTSTGGQV